MSGGTFPNWTFCAQSWSSAVSQVLVPVSWEFLRTESYFPLTEGTKLHFSSTWTPHSVQCLQTRCVESREDSAMGVRTCIIRTMRGFRCNRRTVGVVVFLALCARRRDTESDEATQRRGAACCSAEKPYLEQRDFSSFPRFPPSPLLGRSMTTGSESNWGVGSFYSEASYRWRETAGLQSRQAEAVSLQEL